MRFAVLEVIDLTDNRLAWFDFRVVRHWPRLRHLKLQRNRITVLSDINDGNIGTPREQPITLHLQHNPYLCAGNNP